MGAKILTAGLLAVLLGTTALADTSSINSSITTAGETYGILENSYVKAGVNGVVGTFGSGGNTSPGLLFDSTGTGTFNTGYDYLTPGSPFDGFSVKITDTDGGTASNYHNNNANVKQIGGTANLTDGNNTLSWTGDWTHNSSTWSITNTYTLGATLPYIDITSSITAGSAAHSLSFGRFIDPDARAAAGDSSATDNVLGYGVIPDSNVAFSEATVSRYALGLYSTDSNVDAGITGWSNEADAYTENAVDGDGSLTNTGDNTIGLSWNWTGISAGDILTANYAYIFGPSAFDAAEDAITGGAGGGADVSSWGTLTDVGSATDAASGGGTPTLVSTSTETITSTSEAVSSTLPVLTASITHHESSVAAGVQTIDRETTTSVTTPMEVTTTSFDRTTETYSDDSVVVTDGTATSTTVIRNDVVTTVTDPGSFVGRMDQANQMLGLDVHRNLGIGNGISGGRISHDMANGYSGESNVLSVGGRLYTDNGMSLGAGLNRVTTTMTGTGSTGSIDSTVLSFEASKHIDDKGVTVTGNVNTASQELSYSRTIGDFSANGETAGRDNWGTLTVEKSQGTVRPFAGYTIGTRSVDAYAETGDTQALLLHEAVDETYRYATVGLNIDAGIFTASLAKDFNDADSTRIGLGIDKSINDSISISASANRTMAGDNTSTFLTAGIRINF